MFPEANPSCLLHSHFDSNQTTESPIPVSTPENFHSRFESQYHSTFHPETPIVAEFRNHEAHHVPERKNWMRHVHPDRLLRFNNSSRPSLHLDTTSFGSPALPREEFRQQTMESSDSYGPTYVDLCPGHNLEEDQQRASGNFDTR